MNRLEELEASVVQQVRQQRRKAKRHPLSETKFGTGEHVMTGQDNATEALKPATKYSINGVDFGYGEIIAMADLYETYDDMVAAPRSELTRIRRYIQKSTRHFRRYWNRRIPRGTRTNTSTAEWESATGSGRRKSYSELARENYAHFSPTDPSLAPAAAGPSGDNKTAWQTYHRRALQTAAGNRNNLKGALSINAFGDHYLTDAFASGHLFNKNDVAMKFRSRAYSGNSLNDAGKAMIKTVAEIAWNDRDLRNAFSRIEVTRRWAVDWDIDSIKKFKGFLKGLAEQMPDIVAGGLIAKVVHDELNRTSISVQDRSGGRPWQIRGDSHLDDTQLPKILGAVKQSVQNVQDAAAGSIAESDAFNRVWEKVPRPTRQSAATIRQLIDRYTNPRDSRLHSKAAEVLIHEYDTIISAGLAQGRFAPADRSILDRIVNWLD